MTRRPISAARLFGMPLLLCAALSLGACSSVRESRINPFNWFGADESRRVNPVAIPAGFAETRELVDQVTSLKIERTPGGAIVHAVGLPPRQGYWDTELVRAQDVEAQAGTLVFDFLVEDPIDRFGTGPAQSREVTVATFLSDQDLDGVRRIVVRGVQNLRRVSR